MPVHRGDADRALELLEKYHEKLTKPQDKALRGAIERVIRIFQSRLFLALLDIQEFYEATLLDGNKSQDQKADETIQAAKKWEHQAGSEQADQINQPKISLPVQDERPKGLMVNEAERYQVPPTIPYQNDSLPPATQPDGPKKENEVVHPSEDYECLEIQLERLSKCLYSPKKITVVGDKCIGIVSIAYFTTQYNNAWSKTLCSGKMALNHLFTRIKSLLWKCREVSYDFVMD